MKTTAEEILNEYGCPEIPFNENISILYPAILAAMQEFAESYHAEKVAEVTDEEIEKSGIKEPVEISINDLKKMSYWEFRKWRKS